MCDAVRLVDRDALRPAALRELPAEPALVHPGVTHHADDLTVAGERARERRLQGRRLLVAADEA